ncbi:prophage endopeptidase tail family protein [Bacillus subtilis]|uniref:prophage endopeptidase tail family protein n=1 Tax=Bacillus subtilis TaxID=1423 RepID=UPI00240E3FAE|nr:prophage endopeptidase tail family protein [Bacillus subtilis]WEZ22176.1 prophage endopeptidase tail family protein [Bacillus subtilis]
MFVHDIKTGQKHELIHVEPKVNDDVTGKKDLSFSITLTEYNQIPFNALVGRNFIIIDEVRYKKQQYFINTPTIKQEGALLTKDITATHIYSFRAIKHVVHETIEGTKTLNEALKHAVKGSEITFTIMPDAKGIGAKKLEGFGNKKTSELMDEIISTFGVEIIPDNTHLYIYKKAGKEIVKRLDNLSNLTSLQITTSEDNTTTRVRGYGKLKEEKDILGDQSIPYDSKTGTWAYDSSLKADYTKKIGATFSFSFTGTGFKFKTLVSKLGGKWEFKIGDQTKTISVYKDSAPTEKEFDVIRGLDNKTYKVVATFKGRDSNNPNTKGAKKADPVMYLLRGNIIGVYRTFKNEDEKYVFPPVTYVHPEEKKFLINGQPSWAEPVTDDSITKKEDMIKLLKTKVNPYAEVSYDADYVELLDQALADIEEPVMAGDTIRVYADTPLNGITFDGKLRATGASYNPLRPEQPSDLTIDGKRKSRVDMEIEEKKRAKNQEQAIKNYQNQLASGLAEINQIKQSLANTQASQQTTYTFSLQFLNGEWSVSSGDGFASLAASILSLNTDDDYAIQYVTGDANSIMKEAGYTLYAEDVDTNIIHITLYKDGKISDPLGVPEGSKVKILIVGQK